jgi:hypothetical protein
MMQRHATWHTRSLLGKWAHIIERIGLATAGGSCGLFVAAHIGRANVDLLGSGVIILIMMLYGALGFYLGIDLPPHPDHKPQLPLLRAHASRTDAVELLSAAGTFLASITAFISVWIIILDMEVRTNSALFAGFCWLTGVTMQIAAGTIVRARRNELSAL